MESLVSDIRYALRGLWQRPLFAAVAGLSIAIGIGANTTIFSVINRLFLEPPAGIVAPERVVEVSRTTGGRGRDTFGYPELLDMRAGTDVFEHLAGWNAAALSYADAEGGRQLSGMAVSHNYFEVMGLRPLRGRFFSPDEDRTPLTHPVAVISESFWRGQLAADPGVVGRTLLLNRHTFTVIGVSPAEFRSHMAGLRTDVWVPMMMMGVVQPGFEDFASRQSSWLMAVGRLREGVTPAQAQSAARALLAASQPPASATPDRVRSAAVEPIGAVPAAARGPASAFTLVLLALTGLVLLVTCANVAGMLLARAASREREIAVRLALGSSRRRLVRQLVVESTLLFLLGGVGGTLIAAGATRAIAAIPIPAPLPVELNLAPDLRVLGAGLGLALLTGLLFGLVPALQVTRPDLAGMMKATGVATGRSGRMRRVFVMSQVAFSMLLLLSAGLFIRALQRAASVSAGFDPAGVYVVRADLSTNGYDAERGRLFVTRLLETLSAAPGVSAASTAEDLPLDLGRSGQPVWVESPAADETGAVGSDLGIVSHGYFDALRIRVVEGRAFDARDVSGSQPVAVVSRTFATRVWPGESAIGRVLRMNGRDGEALRIVGVVDDVKNSTLMEAPSSMFYVPLAQVWSPQLSVIARVSGTEGAATLAAVLRQADPALALTEVRPLESITAFGLLPQRLAASITTALGALALLLSAMGVYGVIAYTVTQRTREIGIRVALGARARDIRRNVVAGGVRLVLPGVLLGLGGGVALSFTLRGFILGVGPADPVVFASVTLLLLGAVILACWIPARRAAGVQPMAALRTE